MPNISEEIYELSANLLFQASAALSSIVVDAANLIRSSEREAFSALIDAIQNKRLEAKEQEAVKKLRKAVYEDGEIPLQVTVMESDREIMEKWLKKQDVLYVASKADDQNVTPGFEKCIFTFLEKDAQAVNNAIALTQKDLAYINELPPETFLYLHENRDLSVVDNLNVYELEMFRELSKDYGLVYASILTPPEENAAHEGDTYKILVLKKDSNTASAIMQQVSWAMTGEYRNGIKEKVKERLSIKAEVQALLEKGVKDGTVTVKTKAGETREVENARYIVHQREPHQFIKLTSKGFVHFKFNNEVANISNGDPDYEEKLQFVLGEFSGAVIYDAEEWELNGLEKGNLRKNHAAQKASVFPSGFDKTKDIQEIQKARKKRAENKDSREASNWLFDEHDSKKVFSETYEVRYENDSEGLEESVSVHFNDARAMSERYKYIEVAEDEKSVDKIIRVAKERSEAKTEFSKRMGEKERSEAELRNE